MEEMDVSEPFDPYCLPIPYEESIVVPKEEDTIFKAVRFNDIATILRRLREGYEINKRHNELNTKEDTYTVHVPSRMQRSLRLKQYSVLHVAVIHGTLETIEALLSHGADINGTDYNQLTPIMTAVAVQRPDVLSLLIQKSANVNCASASGRTPLLIAIENKCLTMVKNLLAAGADPNTPDAQGTTPLFMCFKSKESIVIDIIAALLQGGADVNHTNRQRATPLMMAAQLGDIGACKVLLESGADINMMDIQNKNALHLTSGVKTATFLINNGAASDYPDRTGKRPIDKAFSDKQYLRILMLFRSDCHRTPELLGPNPEISYPIYQLILDEIYQPRPLQRLCRQKIRQLMSPFNCARVGELPLPRPLKDFLLAKHIDLST